MWNDAPSGRNDRGFTLIELLVVVGIIGVLAAVAIPNLIGALRNSRVNAATRLISSDLASARGRAIMTNTNAGVSFVVVDADSYRLIQEDLPAGPPDQRLGPIHDLPDGVRFVVSGAGTSSIRFNRLGAFCSPGAGSCAAAVAPVCTADEAPTFCTVDSAGPFFDAAAGSPGEVGLTLVDRFNGRRRVVQVAPGGRVVTRR